tara:strand:- start:202 stop:786 length:585 start_codon:yes stop_codon:yes gene_type:complete
MESYTCFDNNNRRLYHNKKKGWYNENGKPTEVDFEEQTLSVVCDLEGNRVKFIKKDSGFIPLKIALINDILMDPQQPSHKKVVEPVQSEETKKPSSITKNEDFKSEGYAVPLKWAEVNTVQSEETKKPSDFKSDGYDVPLKWAEGNTVQSEEDKNQSHQIPAKILAILNSTENFENDGNIRILSQNLKKALEEN